MSEEQATVVEYPEELLHRLPCFEIFGERTRTETPGQDKNRIELTGLRRLYTLQSLIGTVHLLFQDFEFNIQSLVKFHEAVNVIRQPIDSLLPEFKSVLNLFPKTRDLEINGIESAIDPAKIVVMLLEPVVDLAKPYIGLLKPGANDFFERGDLLVNSAGGLFWALLCHAL